MRWWQRLCAFLRPLGALLALPRAPAFIEMSGDESRLEQCGHWIADVLEYIVNRYGLSSFESPIDDLMSKVVVPHFSLYLLICSSCIVYAFLGPVVFTLLAQYLLTVIGNRAVCRHFGFVTSVFTIGSMAFFYDLLAYAQSVTWEEFAWTFSVDLFYAPAAAPNLFVAFGHVLRADYMWVHVTIVVKLGVMWTSRLLHVRGYNRAVLQRAFQFIEYTSRFFRTVAPCSRWWAYFVSSGTGDSPAFLVILEMLLNFPLGRPCTETTATTTDQTDPFIGRFFMAYYAKYKLFEIIFAFNCCQKLARRLVVTFARRLRQTDFKESEVCDACREPSDVGIQIWCQHRLCIDCINTHACSVCDAPYEIVIENGTIGGADGFTQQLPRMF